MTEQEFADAVVEKLFKAVEAREQTFRAQFDQKLEELRNAKVEKGERGEAGPPGAPGEAGPVGSAGEKGDKGEAGTVGEKGLDGKDGRDGRDGKDGIASRDEMAALVNAEVERRLPIEVAKAVDAYAATLPDVRYRDVWRADNEYKQGNFVTFGGSIWHCNKSGTSGKPGDGGDDWTLAAKRGRDGKDK